MPRWRQPSTPASTRRPTSKRARVSISSQCQQCHGPTGDQIAGIDLRRGHFRRSTSDEDLAKVITTGVAEHRHAAVFTAATRSHAASSRSSAPASIRPAPRSRVGNAARGQALFEGKGACATCHRVNGDGPRVAPDLSDIGAARTPAALQRSLIDPTARMMPINRPVRVVTKDGQTIAAAGSTKTPTPCS